MKLRCGQVYNDNENLRIVISDILYLNLSMCLVFDFHGAMYGMGTLENPMEGDGE